MRSVLPSHAFRIVVLAGSRGECKNTVSAPSPSPQTKPRTIPGLPNNRTSKLDGELFQLTSLHFGHAYAILRTVYPLREKVICTRYAVNIKGQEVLSTIAFFLHVLMPEQSCLLLYSLSLVPAAIHFITSYIYTHYAI